MNIDVGSLRCKICDKELKDYERVYCSDCNNMDEDIEDILKELSEGYKED